MAALATVVLAGLAVPAVYGVAAAATVHTGTLSSPKQVTPFAAAKPVKPGPLASLTVSPATATIAPGGTQSYTVTGYDANGNSRGAITNAKFTIKPDGSCTGATCTATQLGTHTVTAKSGKISGTATLTVSSPQADLAVTESVSDSTPYYYSPVSFTTTVTNTSTATESDGVTVAVSVPAGLISPSGTASAGSYDAGTWTVGSLAPGASATLVISGYAGDVSLGTQTLTATVSATTADPNTANNTASAGEASQPAHLGATITPFPTNPSNVDVSLPGYEGWTASAYNVENPSAPAPNPGGSPAGDWDSTFFCSTASGNPCPAADGTDDYNQLTLEYLISSLAPDTYTITLQVCPNTSNYTGGCVITSLTFTVSNSGAG